MENNDMELKKVNLYELLADKLESKIIGDANLFGQKLPSEQELAKNYGVSRNIVREALKLLKERGLITSHTGDGSYVTKPELPTLTNVISRMLVMHNIDAADSYEVLVILECKACSLATQRASEADFDILTAINRQMDEKQNDLNMRVDLDAQFHAQIADISGNTLLSIFVKSMKHLHRKMIRQALQSEGGSQDGINYHDKIIAALRARDAEQAELTMRGHLEESMRRHKEFETMISD
jgi:DNA-binding FadR family transcriptional regulator